MTIPHVPGKSVTDKRRFSRHTYQRRLLLEFPGSPTMAGETRDVSLGGVFLLTIPPPVNISVGQEGFLRLETRHNTFNISCKVVYVNDEGLALNLLGQEAAFGLALSMDAFEQIKMPDKPVSAKSRVNAPRTTKRGRP